jgi:hypothetical protein
MALTFGSQSTFVTLLGAPCSSVAFRSADVIYRNDDAGRAAVTPPARRQAGAWRSQSLRFTNVLWSLSDSAPSKVSAIRPWVGARGRNPRLSLDWPSGDNFPLDYHVVGPSRNDCHPGALHARLLAKIETARSKPGRRCTGYPMAVTSVLRGSRGSRCAEPLQPAS